MPSSSTTPSPNPVGYHCDHSDEPSDQRTHHSWEFVEDEGFVFTHQPDTISAHGGTQDYLKPEQRDRRCPRAVPVYAVDVPALLAEIDRMRGEIEDRERSIRYFDEQSKRRKAELAEEKRETAAFAVTCKGWEERAERVTAERDEARRRLHDAAMTRTWTNEDGKKFVFVEDIAPHLLGPSDGGAS